MSPDTPTIVFPDPGYFSYYDFPGRQLFKWIPPDLALALYVTLLIAGIGTVLWRVSARTQTHATGLYWTLTLGALFFHAAYIDRLVEDSYITLRYAANALAGHGLVWNVGETPIEGFSNFLYTILLVILGAVGAPLADSSRVVSLLATAGALVLLRRLCLMLEVRRPVADLAPLLAVSHPTVASCAGAGLEASLFALLIVLTFVTYTKGRMVRASVCAAAAWATRPDGIVVFAVLAAAEVWRAWTTRRPERLLRFAAPFLAACFALTLFRYLYFGDVIPNSVRAKAVMGGEVILAGGRYVLSSMGSALTGFEFLVPLVVLAVASRPWPISVLGPAIGTVGAAAFLNHDGILGRTYVPNLQWTLPLLIAGGVGLFAVAARKVPRPWMPVLLFCVSFTGAVVLAGGDWMAGDRYLLPVLLLLPALAAAQLGSGWDSWSNAVRMVILVLALCLVGFRVHATSALRDAGRIEESELSEFAIQGQVLRDAGLGHLSVAMTEVGIRAFVFNGPVLDVCGLNNRTLATLPVTRFSAGHSRCNHAAALALRPPLSLVGPEDETSSSYRLIVVGFQRRERVDYFELWARPDHFDDTVHRLRSARLR